MAQMCMYPLVTQIYYRMLAGSKRCDVKAQRILPAGGVGTLALNVFLRNHSGRPALLVKQV